MKRIIMTLIVLLVASVVMVMAQTDERTLTCKERKAVQARMDSIQHDEAVRALRDTAFTLQAGQVVFKRGYRAYVSSSTNFVSVAGGRATVQVSFNIPVSGPNGMGGITVEGMIGDYKTRTDKKGVVYTSFTVLGSAISAQLFITLYPGQSEASVEISPNFNSRRLTLEGEILPADKSFVVQGRAL